MMLTDPGGVTWREIQMLKAVRAHTDQTACPTEMEVAMRIVSTNPNRPDRQAPARTLNLFKEFASAS